MPRHARRTTSVCFLGSLLLFLLSALDASRTGPRRRTRAPAAHESATVALKNIAPLRRTIQPVSLRSPRGVASPHLCLDAFLVGSVIEFVSLEPGSISPANVSVGVAGDALLPLSTVEWALPLLWTSQALDGAVPAEAAVRVRATSSEGSVDTVLRLEQSAEDRAPGDRASFGLCTNAHPSDVHLLRAWAAYWALIGTDAFYIYWRGAPDAEGALLAAVVGVPAAVTVIPWPYPGGEWQQAAIESCYRRFSRSHTFLGSYDLDELLVLPPGETLSTFFSSFPPTWASLISDDRWVRLNFTAMRSFYFNLELRHWAAAPFAAVSSQSGGRYKWVARTAGALAAAPIIEVHELHRGGAGARGPGGIVGTWDDGSASLGARQFFLPSSRALHFHIINAKHDPRDEPEMDAHSDLRWRLALAVRNLTSLAGHGREGEASFRR